MTPWVFHGLCMAVVLLLAQHSRKAVLAAAAPAEQAHEVFGYGPVSRWTTIVCTGLMGVLLLIGERMQESQNPEGESLIPFVIALVFNACLLVVLDRRVVMGVGWVSSGLSLLHPRRVPKAAFLGAKITSTAFFGGWTTFHTATGRVTVWHQVEDHRSLLQRLRALT